ncbi:dynamin family protein [Streptomyces massasporeus]|uniref:dynamin family protein n=1 Tax=Streptomyces massasporeus TaxID=67324 RepID=UPI0036F60BBA
MPVDDPLLALRLEEETREALKAVPAFPEEAADAFRNARRELAELRRVASTPVTIGVVGEFSAGKSSVIGTLLGDPALLPVHKHPATAQVSALALTVGESGLPARLGGRAVVEFFDHQQVTDCLDYMIRSLAEEIAKADRGSDLTALAVIREALTGTPPTTGPVWRDPGIWRDYDAWVRRTLWATEQDNEALRTRTVEIRKFSDALFQLHPSLFGDTVTLATQDALSVTSRGRAPQPGTPYPARPPYEDPLTRQDLETHARPDGMTSVAPLIRRVDYTVSVPPGTWGPADAGALLLDFPGLGAESSRDAFLCGSQLRNVETILVVGRGDLLGSRDMAGFYGMMQAQGHSKEKLADAILVAINKWDEASVPDVPDGGKADGAAVQQLSDDLSAAAAAAGMLVAPRLDRLQLISVWTAAADPANGLARPLAALVPADKDPAAKAAALTTARRRWAELAARVTEVDPRHHWAQDLTNYGADGGLEGLRQLLAEHIDTHGADQKRQTVGTQAARALQVCELLLSVAMTHAIGEHSEEAKELARRFEALRGAINRLMADLHRLQNPARAREGDGRTVLERLALRATELVYSWPQWGELLASVENGQIAKSAPSANQDPALLTVLSPEQRKIYLESLDAEGRSADTTRAFQAQYARTYESLREEAAGHLAAWSLTWAAEYEDLFTKLHRWLDEPATKARLTSLFSHVEGMPPAARLLHAQILTSRDVLVMPAVAKGEKAADGDASGFPRRPDQVLPWSHDYPDDPSSAVRAMENSQYAAARMRHDIVTALRDEVETAFTQMLKETVTEMALAVGKSAPAVPDSIQISTMIAAAARAAGDQEAAEAAEDGLAALREVLRRWKEAS